MLKNTLKSFCCPLAILFILMVAPLTLPIPTHASNANIIPAAGPEKAQAFRSVSPEEAKKIIERRQDLVFLDVRTPQELQKEGGIQGAVLVPFWAVMQNKLNVPKDKPIMLVCAVGGRSYAAGQMLVRFGYQEVYNLSGGLDAWKKNGLPVVH